MRLTGLRKIEQAVAASDSGGIFERWRFGRLLQVDPEWTTAAGNLRHGRLAKLVTEKRSEREIRYRIQCARAYPTASQIGNAIADLETWFALTQAGFPPYPAPEGERPYDPRTTAEIKRDQKRTAGDILPEPWEQTVLWAYFDDKPAATLFDAERYAVGQAELSARMSQRCDDRLANLDELKKAVNGDMTCTLAEAQEALEAQNG